MNGSSQPFVAGSGLADQQNGGIGCGHGAGTLDDLLHRGRNEDEALEGVSRLKIGFQLRNPTP